MDYLDKLKSAFEYVKSLPDTEHKEIMLKLLEENINEIKCLRCF